MGEADKNEKKRYNVNLLYCQQSDRFEFLYKYYHNYKNILSCERHCVIYMIDSFIMKNHWEKYCKYYNSLNKNSMITRISECMSEGESDETQRGVGARLRQDARAETLHGCAGMVPARVQVESLVGLGQGPVRSGQG